MDTYIVWLVKIILAHLLTDFVLQPRSWIESRNLKHFSSPYLYRHGAITGLVVLLLLGWEYWWVALVIFITHTLIDGWKSYQPQNTRYFFIDQLLHLLVMLVCWYLIFLHPEDITAAWEEINTKNVIVVITAFVFVSQPASIIIGQITQKWREQIADGVSLGNAGKWIGILERLIILALVLNNQYETMGLLIAAKSLLRFSEANRPEVKTEYLLIGTLISVSLAVLTGLVALELIQLEL
jgi:hypothetical protein